MWSLELNPARGLAVTISVIKTNFTFCSQSLDLLLLEFFM